MKEFEGLVALGRLMKTTSATRGALIQLEEGVAYMVNEPKSILLKLEFNEKLGTGTFYAGEAPTVAEKVQRRDDKVLFEWRERGKIRRLFVRDKPTFSEKAEGILEKYYAKPEVKVPVDFLDDLDKDILITRVRVKGDEIITQQRRSDGTVMMENVVKLSRGLTEAENYPDSGEVSVFTQDLVVLKGFVRNPLYIALNENKPISVRGAFNFGAGFKGIIAFLVYEV